MALLTKKFDVLRGWPKEGALDETFPIASGQTLAAGDVVMLNTSGQVTAATVPTVAKPVFVVVEGNDDYSGTYTGKAVVLRGNCLIRVENFVAGSWDEGLRATYETATGKYKLATTGDQIIAEVWKDDRTVDGTLVLYFNPGYTLAV